MNEQQQDKEFEAFLAGKSKLKRPYRRLGKEQPPAEVDQRILAAARQVAETRRAELGPRGGWLKPVALAATVLLSFSVVMNIGVDWPEGPEADLPVSARAPATRDAQPAGAEPLSATRAQPQRELGEPAGRIATPDSAAFESAAEMVPEQTGPGGIDLQQTDPDRPATLTAVQPGPAEAEQGNALVIVSAYLAGVDAERAAVRVGPDLFMRKSARLPAATLSGSMADAGTASVAGDEPPDKAATAAAETPPAGDAEALLREVQRLATERNTAEARRVLAEFLARYPEHPVSVTLASEAMQP